LVEPEVLPALDRFLEICKASGINSAGAARLFVVSGIAAAHSARGDALNFPARPVSLSRSECRGKGHKSGRIPLNNARLGRPFR
jgi:hypothetical protein